jgi:hypothetical protein
MNLATDLPRYERRVTDEEDGSGFGLEFDTYRALCRSALSIIRGHPNLMAVYKLTESGLGLDIFIGDLCLTILVRDDELGLFCCEIDSVNYETVLISDNCDESWSTLVKIARKQI